MTPGLALSVGLVAGAVLAFPIGFALGVITRRDRRVTRYVSPSLTRSVQ